MAKKNEKIESATATETGVATTSTANGPSAAMLAMFAAPKGYEIDKLERRNAPTLVKPKDVPMDGIVSGEIIKTIDSPNSAIKGKCLWLKHPETGTEFLFPATGVIRQALAPGKTGDDLQAALDKEVGKMFIAKRLPNGFSAKYDKEMFEFEVYTVAKSA